MPNIQDIVGAAGASTPAGLAIAGIQGVAGAVQSIAANQKLKKLFKERKAYKTQQETYDIKNATAYNQQTGYGADTLNFLQNQGERGLSNGLNTLLQLNGDANMVSGLQDNFMQEMRKIGADDSMLQMRKFDQFLAATDSLAKSKDAEFQSADNLIKDQMQMYAQKAQAGQKNIQSALNLGLSSLAGAETQNLLKSSLTLPQGTENLNELAKTTAPSLQFNAPSLSTDLKTTVGDTIDYSMLAQYLKKNKFGIQ